MTFAAAAAAAAAADAIHIPSSHSDTGAAAEKSSGIWGSIVSAFGGKDATAAPVGGHVTRAQSARALYSLELLWRVTRDKSRDSVHVTLCACVGSKRAGARHHPRVLSRHRPLVRAMCCCCSVNL